MKFIFIFLFLFGILISVESSEIYLNITSDKYECYVGEEVNINITINPGFKGVYCVVYLLNPDGVMEELINYPRGCSACGVKKSPINFHFNKVLKKKFMREGIYEIFGEIEDVNYQERKYESIKIIVKEQENKTTENELKENKSIKYY
ncbi:MAG: hypothetical protein ACK4YO_01280 [Candidatus Altarchaeaceae archaeon]